MCTVTSNLKIKFKIQYMIIHNSIELIVSYVDLNIFIILLLFPLF
jgi:hypothetical protein